MLYLYNQKTDPQHTEASLRKSGEFKVKFYMYGNNAGKVFHVELDFANILLHYPANLFAIYILIFD